MKKKIFCCIVFLFLAAYQLLAQEAASKQVPADKFSIGMGIGQDYGGFGGHAVFYPQPNIGLFLGLGYNLVGAGYNVGAKFRLLPAKPAAKVTPYALVMYGYTAAIKVTDASYYDKIFYGATLGAGIDLKPYMRSKLYYSFGLYVPLRGNEVSNYMDDLKNYHGVEFKNDLIPVTFSIGLKYKLN